MVSRLVLDDPPVSVWLRRSARARRMTLRLSSRDLRVYLTLPGGVSISEARHFLSQHRRWLAEQIARRPGPVEVGHGATLPLLGLPHLVAPGPGRAPRIDGRTLVVPGSAAAAGARVRAFLIAQARERLSQAAARHAAALGRAPRRISLRDPATRWGSCSSRGDLMFSWRLVMAPEAVLDYVAAHEAAHLVEMNHSPRFWALVETLCPDWRTRRDWLRRHGAELLRYRFG